MILHRDGAPTWYGFESEVFTPAELKLGRLLLHYSVEYGEPLGVSLCWRTDDFDPDQRQRFNDIAYVYGGGQGLAPPTAMNVAGRLGPFIRTTTGSDLPWGNYWLDAVTAHDLAAALAQEDQL